MRWAGPGMAALGVALVSFSAMGCDEEPGDRDGGGGIDAPMTGCGADVECDDGLFCNGAERCDPSDADADDAGCVSSAPACGDQMCNEAADECIDICTVDTDADGDGHDNVACGGDDCDDTDDDRFPGNDEICDAASHDEDCDATTFGFRDTDGDGFPDAACCNDGEAGAICGTDCDDMQSGANPDSPEVCNGRDDDCDGALDEGVGVELVEDGDGDGFGSAAPDAATMTACGPSEGWQVERVDCDDDAAAVHPGAAESCNGEDDDCDEAVDEVEGGCACTTPGGTQACGSDRAGVGVCTTGTETCVAGTWTGCNAVLPASEESMCDDRDEDCDGTVDEGVGIDCYPDTDDDGYAELGSSTFNECRDSNPARAASPYNGCPIGSTGTAPAGSSYDCDDDDDALVRPIRCYPDNDGDTYGRNGSTGSLRCGACASGTVNRRGDCCDSDSTSRPGAAYSSAPNDCGSYDRNCNGTVEEQYGMPTGFCVPGGGSGNLCLCSGGSCQGYVSDPPSCPGSGSYYTGCSGSGLDCTNSTTTRSQRCR